MKKELFENILKKSHNTRAAASFLTSKDRIYEALGMYSDKWNNFESVVEMLYKAFGKNRERAKQFLICARKATGKIPAAEAVAEYVTDWQKSEYYDTFDECFLDWVKCKPEEKTPIMKGIIEA